MLRLSASLLLASIPECRDSTESFIIKEKEQHEPKSRRVAREEKETMRKGVRKVTLDGEIPESVA